MKTNHRKTPIMGWASWNKFRVNISEDLFKAQLQAMIDLGLRDLGYTYFNIDDGFQHGRGEDGFINIDEAKFPSGMKAFADYAHERGFKAGIYTDAGSNTCAQLWDGLSYNHNVGLFGHDESDLNRYLVEWGYDFIKVDWCGGLALKLSQQERYSKISEIIRGIEDKTDCEKIFNICSWEFPGAWAAEVADSWRTGADITPDFDSILYQIDKVAKSETKSLELTGPGHINDLDMLQVGNGMNYEEDKSHFSMWALMSTPLMLGMDITSIDKKTLEIIKNEEVISINQDVACLPPTLEKTVESCEIWVKPLGSSNSDEKAIAILNRENEEAKIAFGFSEIGLKGALEIRDLWAHKDLPFCEKFEASIPAHGIVMLRIKAK